MGSSEVSRKRNRGRNRSGKNPSLVCSRARGNRTEHWVATENRARLVVLVLQIAAWSQLGAIGYLLYARCGSHPEVIHMLRREVAEIGNAPPGHQPGDLGL